MTIVVYVLSVLLVLSVLFFVSYRCEVKRQIARCADQLVSADDARLASNSEAQSLNSKLQFQRLALDAAEVGRKVMIDRLTASQADADRLAAIVSDYVRLCDETAKLFKDEHPPALVAEREALSQHEKLLQSRHDPNQPHQS